MSHYYQFDDKLESQKRNLFLYINDEKLVFVSDKGVFSNTQIDYGSYALIKETIKLQQVDTLLDVGCGYGVIGISLRYFNNALNVDMIDINPRAVALSLENISSLNVSNVNAFVSDGFTSVSKKYDRIVINPPIRTGKVVIYKMFEDSATHLNSNGELIIVIKKDLGANSAISKLKTLFKDVEVIAKDKGYFIIRSHN